MRCVASIAVALIIGASIIISTKIVVSAFSEKTVVNSPSTREDGNRYQIEIIGDKGKNWNGIYVFDRKTGSVRFYATPDSFE